MLLLLLVPATGLFAQSLTAKAYECYQQQDFECARSLVDSAIVSDERSNSQTWQLRGVIYRKLETPAQMDYRNIAIESFVQARNLDKENAYKAKIDDLLYNTIIRYYNDAVTHLESNELKESEKSYTLYKDRTLKYLNPKQSFDQSDIDYYNALGSRYMSKLELLESGSKKDEVSEKAISLFQHVIDIDSVNWQANFNIGIIHYNHGADLAMHADPFTFTGDIEELDKMLTQSADLFRMALPFLKRAKRIEPNNISALEGLTGCYYGLNDDENYKKFQKLLDEQTVNDWLDKYNKNPKDIKVVRELVRIYSTTLKDEAQYDKFKTIYDQLNDQE